MIFFMDAIVTKVEQASSLLFRGQARGSRYPRNDKWLNLVDIGREMVGWILKKILGSKNQRELKRQMPIVHRINEFDEQFKGLSDEALRAKTAAWKEEFAKIPVLQDQWNRLTEILPEAFAVVKNAARRLKDRQHTFTVCDQPMTSDMGHFDVQLLGGVVLHRGRIAEMATGEGKTLVAPLPL